MAHKGKGKPHVDAVSGHLEKPEDPLYPHVRALWDGATDLLEAISKKAPLVEPLKALLALINKVKQVQKKVKKGEASRIDLKRDFRPFIKWLTDNGYAKDPRWEVEWDPHEGHGIYATDDIPEGEVVISVPVKFMMTIRTALESRLALLLHNDELLQKLPSAVLALHLLIEKYNLQSYWTPYLNSLPKVYPTPLYWKDEEFLSLESTSMAMREVCATLSTACRVYSHVYMRLHTTPQLEQAVIKKGAFTWEVFCWAFSAVDSRKNNNVHLHVGRENTAESLALVPVFDLINQGRTDDEINVHAGFDPDAQCLTVLSKAPIKKGTEIKMFYGPRPNYQLLAHQGFTIPDNKFDLFLVPFAVRDNDKFREQKVKILADHKLPSDAFFSISKADPVGIPLLAFMRVLVADNEDDLKNAGRAFNNEPITLENEYRVYNFLHLKFSQILSGFTKSIPEHKAVYERNTHNFIQQHIEQDAIGELALLMRALEVVAAKKKSIQAKLDKKKQKAEAAAAGDANAQ